MKLLTHFACLLVVAVAVPACLTEDTGEQESPIGGEDASDDETACPAIWVECPDGEAPTDIDGDGCALECSVPCGGPP